MGTKNFQMFKLDLEKAEELEIKLSISIELQKKQESSRKMSATALLTMPKPLSVWITTNYEKFFNTSEYHNSLPVSWEICMQVKEQQFQPDKEQQAGSKLGRCVRQRYILSPCLFNLYVEYIMWNTGLDEAQAELRLPGEISTNSDMQMTPLITESEQEWSSLLMKVKEDGEKVGLKLNIQKIKSLVPSLHGK